MQTVRGSSESHEKATTAVHAALQAFELASGLVPCVILLPRRIFSQYLREQTLLESVLPEAPQPKDPREWADVRVVEHERIEEIEVY